MTNQINQATLDLIANAEGCVLTAYPDPAQGWLVPTIGIGHTTAAGPPAVTKGMKITKDQAYSILRDDLAKVAAFVTKIVKVPLTDNQFGALVSFAFNVGTGNLAESTLLRKLNAKDYAGAAGQFRLWNKAAGKVLPGLTKRRAAEAKLFSTPTST